MITLRNKTGRASQIGYLAKAAGADGFSYAGVGDIPIGVIIESVKRDELCKIQTTGMVPIYISKYTLADKPLRVPIATDGVPKGTAMPVGSETEYVSLGRTLDAGKGLVAATINIGGTVSTGSDLPAGGDSGYMLTKLSAADYDVGWAAGGGTVSAVTGGYGITSTGGTTPDIAFDGTELDIDAGTSWNPPTNTPYILFTSGLVTERISAQLINVSTFVNDSNYTANLGTVTQVTATSPLASSGGTIPNITFDATSIPVMGAALLAEDYILVTETSDSGAMKRKLISAVPLSEFNNNEGWDVGTVTGVTGGYGITSDSDPTTPTIAFDGTELDIDDGTAWNPPTTSPHIVFTAGAVSERRLVTAINLGDFVNNLGWTTNVGTVTQVTATSPLASSGGTTPNITFDATSIPVMGGALLAEDYILVTETSDSGAMKRKLISAVPLQEFNYPSAWDSTGVVESITGGYGISVAGTAAIPIVAFDGSELDIGSVSMGATDYLMAVNGTASERWLISGIPLSWFDNDAGWTTNAGTVTSVTASSPLASSGGTTPNITFDASSIPVMGSALLAEDYILVTETSDSGAMKQKLISAVPLEEFNYPAVWDSTGEWTTDTNGITYTAGNVGIGVASHSTHDLNVAGSVLAGSSTAGTITSTGSVIANTYFQSSDNDMILGPTGSSGYVSLRPYGIGDATNQSIFARASTTIGNNTSISGTLTIGSTTELGGTLGDNVLQYENAFDTITNVLKHRVWSYRDAAGTTWTTARLHDGISIDSSFGTPRTDTKCWYERDPNSGIHYWGNATTQYASLSSTAFTVPANIGYYSQSPLQISSGSTIQWYKLGVLSGTGAKVKIIINGGSGYSSAFVTTTEGYVTIGNADNEYGAWQYTIGDNSSNTCAIEYKDVGTSTSVDVYVKLGTYFIGSVEIVEGQGFVPWATPYTAVADPSGVEATSQMEIQDDVKVTGELEAVTVPTEYGLTASTSSSSAKGGRLRLRNTSTGQLTGATSGGIEWYKADGSTQGAGYVSRIESRAIDAGGTYNLYFETGQDIETPAGNNGTMYLDYLGILHVSSLRSTGEVESYDTSDIRLKNVLGVLNPKEVIDGIMSLNTIRYEQDGKDGLRLGFIAQEVNEVFPENIKRNDDDYLMIHYGKMTVPLMLAVQNHEERILELESEVEELKRKLSKY